MSGSRTEALHDAAEGIDERPLTEVAALLAEGQIAAARSLLGSLYSTVNGAGAMARTIRKGGMLHYVAAGSSGLMAAVDALEPGGTFSIPADQLRIHMAGGMPASVEMPGATEDDVTSGRESMSGASSRDTVIAVSVSGTTPYTLAAILSHPRLRIAALYRSAVFIPTILSFVIVGFAWKLMEIIPLTETRCVADPADFRGHGGGQPQRPSPCRCAYPGRLAMSSRISGRQRRDLVAQSRVEDRRKIRPSGCRQHSTFRSFSLRYNPLWFPLILAPAEATKTLTLGSQVFIGQFVTNWNAVLSALSMAILPVLVPNVIFSRQLIRRITSGAVK